MTEQEYLTNLWWDDEVGLIRGTDAVNYPNARRLVPLSDREALAEIIHGNLFLVDGPDGWDLSYPRAADAIIAFLSGDPQ